MSIIDTHAHLDHVPDVALALQRAFQEGVSDVIAVSTDLQAIQKNLAIQKDNLCVRVHVAFGVHPGEIKVDQLPTTFEFMRTNIQQAVAIGETGLDYWYKWARKDDEEKQKQRDCFEKHLALAKEFSLPIIIHSRGAWKDCLEMTKSFGIQRALFHWYSGPVNILEEILKEGYWVSCSPSLAYSPQSREAMVHAPMERTLIETDSPVFYNHPDGGFQAEPKDVYKTLKAYVELKNINPQEALERLTYNAKDFFKIG